MSKQLSCGQTVTIIGLERGYAKVQIKENVIGYVEAKYIRSIDTQGNSDGRIAELEAEVKTPKQQSTDAITLEPSARPSTSSRTVAPAQSAQSKAPRPQHSDNEREYPKAEIFGGYNYVHLGNDAGSTDGWNAAITGDFHPAFGIKAEFSGIYAKNAAYNSIRSSGYSFLAGPQLTARSRSIDAFGHALFGVTHLGTSFPFGDFRVGASLNAFTMAIGGGVDWHREKWGIRIMQVDYFPWRALGGTANNIRLSAGFIFRHYEGSISPHVATKAVPIRLI